MTKIKTLTRTSIVAAMLVLISGCSVIDSLAFLKPGPSRQQRTVQCSISPNSCIYNGSYVAGEEQYAEREARRMNLAEAERIRSLSL